MQLDRTNHVKDNLSLLDMSFNMPGLMPFWTACFILGLDVVAIDMGWAGVFSRLSFLLSIKSFLYFSRLFIRRLDMSVILVTWI